MTPADPNRPGNDSSNARGSDRNSRSLTPVASGGAVNTYMRSPPAVLAATPSVSALLQALRRRWLFATTLGIAAFMLSTGIFWLCQSTTYSGRALLYVNSVPPKVLGDVDLRTDFANYQRTQIALVRSRLVLNKALSNPKVVELQVVREKLDPISWLEKEIMVDFRDAPEILRISMNGDDAAQLTALLNAISDAYLQEIVYKEHNQRLNRLNKLKDLYGDYDKKLQDKRRIYKQFQIELGTGQVDKRVFMWQYATKELQDAQAQWSKTKWELRQEEISLKMAEATTGPGGALPDKVLKEAVEKHPAHIELKKTITGMEVHRDRIIKNAVHPETEPGYKALLVNLAAKQKELEDFGKKLAPELQKQFDEDSKNSLQFNRYTIKQRISVLKQLETSLSIEVTERTKALDEFKATTVNVEWLKEEIEQAELVTRKVASQMNALEIELLAPPRTNVLEDAIAVQDTDGRLRKSALGGLAIVVIILCSISYWEFRRRRVSTVEDVIRGLQLPLVGTLPALPERMRRGIAPSTARDLQWQALLAESVDSARTMLLHQASLLQQQVFMITSAVGGEGKTLLSCHLAVSLARAGFRTLLIDCDMRRPSVNKILNLNVNPGFSDVLRGQITVDEAIQAGPLDRLWVLTAGTPDRAAEQALAHHGSKDIFKQVKGQYDFILVDSAPVLPVADSLLIAQCVDGVIFSILRDVSRLPSVYAAYERLAALKVNILGAVVNGTQGEYYGARYARYYRKPEVTPEPERTAAEPILTEAEVRAVEPEKQ